MNHEDIKYKGKILCHIFRKEMKVGGSKFLSPSTYSLQLGLLEHPKNTILRDHAHNQNIKYKVNTTQEFLYLEKGEVQVTFYSEDWKMVTKRILKSGDFLLHIAGGHGFKMLKKSRLIEVKQGPYPGKKQAKIYNDKNSIKKSE